jgi:hypothetical protein
MTIASSTRNFALKSALCAGVFLTTATLVWGGQSTPPPEKDQAGGQAGSSGKAPDQMGSRGSTDSPLRKCDSDTPKDKTDKTDKTAKKKKAKKPAPTKSST